MSSRRLALFPILTFLALAASVVIAVSYPEGSPWLLVAVGSAIVFSVLALRER